MALLIFFLWQSLSRVRPIGAAPVPDNSYVSWQDGPPGRGSWNIITSCLTTLFFCVYSALHPNVPDAFSRKHGRFMRCLVVIAYMCLGFLFPETMLVMAWKQWYRARHLTQEVQKYKDKLSEEPRLSMPVNKQVSTNINPLRRTASCAPTRDSIDDWTMAHSYFVVMGGFQFRPEAMKELVASGVMEEEAEEEAEAGDPSEVDSEEISESSIVNRTVLTTAGFLHLLRSGHRDKIPSLSPRDLQDRSKADHFVKFITCVQVIWFVVNLVERLACHVATTELEVNTFAHCLSALCMYLFWMEKPLSVKQPVWIETEGLETWLLMFGCFDMVERRIVASTKLDEKWRGKFGTESRFLTHVHDTPEHDVDCGQCKINRECRPDIPRKGLLLKNNRRTAEYVANLLNSQQDGIHFIDFVVAKAKYLHETRKTNKVDVICVAEIDILAQLWSHLNEIELTEELQHRLFLVRRSDLWCDQGSVGFDRKTAARDYILTLECGFKRHAYASSVREEDLQECSNRLEFFTFGCISFVYGCLHGALWQYYFPTDIERWMWRASCATVAGVGGMCASGFSLPLIYYRLPPKTKARIDHHLDRYRRLVSKDGGKKTWVQQLLKVLAHAFFSVFGIVFGTVLYLSFFCRVFLLIEAFISLRKQPSSAYDDPGWTDLIPHL